MVRTVFTLESCSAYLENLCTSDNYVVGLIIGQLTPVRDVVIHLARTPDEKANEYMPNAANTFNKAKTIFDLSESRVADHAMHVTRMLPGGMHILGLFVISKETSFEDAIFNKMVNVQAHITKLLDSKKYLYGSSSASEEKLLLHMSSTNRQLTSKSFILGSNLKAIAVKNIEWKVLTSNPAWQELECYYEFDEMYPVIVTKSGVSVKQQLDQILSSVDSRLQVSTAFFDGELKDNSETVESITKKKKTKNTTKTQDPDVSNALCVSMFQPCESGIPESVEYIECDGSIHFSGIVASRVYVQSKATIEECINAVKEDILRSLVARFTMHCDALIDDNLLPEEKVCFNEPPRRVLVPLKSTGKRKQSEESQVYFCDYLFPGEAPAEALVSVKELLDVEISEQDVVSDLETPADTEFDQLDRDTSTEDLRSTPQENRQMTYILGIFLAILVLLIALAVHYYRS